MPQSDNSIMNGWVYGTLTLQMLKAGVDIEEICRFTELTPEEVEALNEMAEV